MEAEIWQRLPEELLYMILARLSIRVLGNMRTVCKKWNSLLSSCDALQLDVPNWSLHSTPGFLLQIHWDWDLELDDVEYWVIEAHGSEICKLPLTHHQILVGTCKSIVCISRIGNSPPLSMGIPGTRNWKQLPPPPPPPRSFDWFSGLAFDCCTRRCTVVLGSYEHYRRQHDNNGIVMSIYNSESNAWTQVFTMVANHIKPIGKGVYCKGKFYWVCITLNPNHRNLVVAFNIADGVWTEIPLPQECKYITRESIGECYGQLVLVEYKGFGSVGTWKLNETQVWCHLRTFRVANRISYRSVTINSSGLIMVMDWEMKILMYTWKGEFINREIRLPGLRTSQRPPVRVHISSFESNNLWWPES